ncbi:hypothetical protein K3495_g11443 [Podosphaera aphanis]|nr:hypothetical protein K3495_g11443 [Podosphaera aphanis]
MEARRSKAEDRDSPAGEGVGRICRSIIQGVKGGGLVKRVLWVRSDCDSSWLSQICSEHIERLQPAPREGEEFVFASPQKLKDAVNSRLRRALIGVKLPSPENYLAWIEEVREVAKELESLSDYRPKGASQTKTVLGAPKSGSAQASVSIQPEISKPKLDLDGDTVMGGTNAVLAAIKDLMESNLRYEKNPRKPRAPWRSKKEFKRLVDEGRCTRCTKKGHIGRFCHSHLPAQRPMTEVSSLETADKITVIESENEEP